MLEMSGTRETLKKHEGELLKREGKLKKRRIIPIK